jgi:hypothetical protein
MNKRKDRWNLPRNLKKILFIGQLLLSALGLGLFLWQVINFLKLYLLGPKDFGMYPWTFIFFHPVGGSLFNYLILALFFGGAAVFFYLFRDTGIFSRFINLVECEPAWVAPLLLMLSTGLLCSIFAGSSLKWKITESLFLFLIPFIIRVDFERPGLTRWLIVLVAALLFYEPVMMVTKPAFLMNDYPDIFSQTYIKGKAVDNLSFLQKLQEKDIDSLKIFYYLYNRFEFKNKPTQALQGDDIDFFLKLKNRNLENSQKFIEKMAQIEDLGEFQGIPKGSQDTGPMIQNLKNIDVEGIRQFFLKNDFEVNHQNMGRGQTNHIGHVLNPINEYNLGKPIREIYFQYGMGFTFLEKWIMELWGGVSIQNYYKTYFLYGLYFLLFLLLLQNLFPDPKYVLASFSMLLICFYFLGYLGFFLAPGIIPSIHLFDSSALLFFLLYLRRRKGGYLGGSILLILISTWINSNFGMALSLSLFFSLLLFAVENATGRKRIWLMVVAFGELSANVALLKATSTSEWVFHYYLLGYLSWPAKNLIVAATLVYLILSYGFLVYLRRWRFHLKYVYLFIFIYSQIILTYYFWSGLTSHLPPVISFAWMQLILTVLILKDHILKENPRTTEWTGKIIDGVILLSFLLVIFGGQKFYLEKKMVTANFLDHRTYSWKLQQAQVISTINPELIRPTVGLIQRYSDPKDPRIYILAKYDSLIPFLAGRYSAMPIFDLAGYMFSPREFNEAKRLIQEKRPKFLFVGRNLLQSGNDPWAILYRNQFDKSERASRLERYGLLRRLFLQCQDQYEKVDEGGLLVVYRRKP